MTRVPYATREKMDAAGQAIWDDIETSRGGVARNYAALLNNPQASAAFIGLGTYARYEIATASPRVAHMGGSGGKGGDTARSIGFEWTPEGLETLYLKSKVLIDVRAAGVPYPMSGGWMDIHNLEGLRALAIQLKQLGYTGMHLIHPSHVPVVNEVFSPSPEDVKHWQGLVAAMEEMRATGGAAVTFDGDMVDIAHEATARTMLAIAKEMGVEGA